MLPKINIIPTFYFSIFRCLTYKLSMFVMFVNSIPLFITIFLSLMMQIIFLQKHDKSEQTTFPCSTYQGACATYFGIQGFVVEPSPSFDVCVFSLKDQTWITNNYCFELSFELIEIKQKRGKQKKTYLKQILNEIFYIKIRCGVICNESAREKWCRNCRRVSFGRISYCCRIIRSLAESSSEWNGKSKLKRLRKFINKYCPHVIDNVELMIGITENWRVTSNFQFLFSLRICYGFCGSRVIKERVWLIGWKLTCQTS